jgi:hypothetical protein
MGKAGNREKMKNKIQSYTLLFQTAGDVPAPHSFHVLIGLEAMAENKLKVEFKQEFTEREEIPKEEIEAEGFSEDDDFSWEGELPFFWMERLSQLVARSEWKEAAHTQVLLKDPEGNDWLSPSNERTWIGFTEELIQACLEEGGKELPMEMTLGKLEKNNFYEKVRLEWRFARREIQAAFEGGTKANFGGLDWEESQQLLKDWIENEAMNTDLYQFPKSKGWYWLMNNEIWLPYRKGQRGRIWNWVDDKVAPIK